MKRFFIVIGISIISQVAMAQWTFTTSVSKSGKCSGLEALGANIWAAIGHGVSGQNNFATKEQCEASRASFSGTYSEGGCTTRVITTPCKGPAGALNGVDIYGPSKGSSFNSTNPVNEINDWSNNDMERMLALNPEFKSKEPNNITTGDPAFDNLIENMPYSDEAFSGRMPRGSTHIKTDDNITFIGQPVKGNGIHVPDDFTSKPFDYGLGIWSSDDLKPVELPQEAVRLYGDINYVERKEGIAEKVKTAISSLDDRLDWYKAEDGNVFQYMYTRWGRENVMAGVDLWERYRVGERISNAWDKVKEVASDPLGAWEKKREEIVDGINENKDEHIGSGILFLLKPQNQVMGENAQDTYNTIKGSVNFVFKDISKSVDYAASGKVPDYMKTIEKVGDDMSGLAGRVAERSAGTPNLSKITKPITDVYRQPKEKQGKEISNITGKELKKRAKSTIKDSKYYKSSKEKAIRLLDPNHVITE